MPPSPASSRPSPQTLDSVPGLGPVWTAGLVAEIGAIGRFAGDAALAQYAGLVWRADESGRFQSEDTGMTNAGNTYLRYYLIEAANSVRVHCPGYRAYYQAKLAQSPKHAEIRALVLTARKLVRLVDALLRTGARYRPPEHLQDRKEATPPARWPAGTPAPRPARRRGRLTRPQRSSAPAQPLARPSPSAAKPSGPWGDGGDPVLPKAPASLLPHGRVPRPLTSHRRSSRRALTLGVRFCLTVTWPPDTGSTAYDEDRRVLLADITDVAREVNDRAALKTSTTWAMHLLAQSGLRPAIIAKLYEAQAITKERSAAIRSTTTSPGFPLPVKAKMAYFFARLEQLLGPRPDEDVAGDDRPKPAARARAVRVGQAGQRRRKRRR